MIVAGTADAGAAAAGAAYCAGYGVIAAGADAAYQHRVSSWPQYLA